MRSVAHLYLGVSFGYLAPFWHVFLTCKFIISFSHHVFVTWQQYKATGEYNTENYSFLAFSLSLPKLQMAKNSRVFLIVSLAIVCLLSFSAANPLQAALDSVHCESKGYTFTVKVRFFVL